jgi:hypothetical protein
MYLQLPEGLGQAVAFPNKLVKHFHCTPPDLAEVEKHLKISVSDQDLKAAVENAARNAVSWAWNAASALQMSPWSNRTKNLFRDAFGTFPECVPRWRPATAGWVDRGDLVAIRLNSTAKILFGGSIRYFCWGSSAHCPGCEADVATYFACISPSRYRICLGGRFWEAWRGRREHTLALTLLHEALHIYFTSIIGREHEKKGPYGNAFCYELFVGLFSGH